MTVGDITGLLETLSPARYALEWDNVGLMTGSEKEKVTKILVTLDVDDAAVENAIHNKVELIVSHHPLIFGTIHSVTDETLTGRRLLKLISHNISVYSMHTNFDICGSMGQLAADALGMYNAKTMEVTAADGKGLGKIADVSTQKMTVREWIDKIKSAFHISTVKVFGDVDRIVSKAAVYPGAGNSSVQLAVECGVDMLITGDIGHHAGIDGAAQGLTIVDAGHYGVEHLFIEYMADYLRQHTSGIIVMAAPLCHPFTVY